MAKQLLNSELVLKATFKEIAKPLPLLNVAGVPEPEVDEQTYSVPLKQGKRSAGGLVSYGPITGSKIYDDDVDEPLKVALQKLQGGGGNGTGAFHAAPGGIVRQAAIEGETYELNVLRCWLSDGQNSDGDGITMLNVEFGVQGVGK